MLANRGGNFLGAPTGARGAGGAPSLYACIM
jgi:hypothetical protein